MTKHTQGPYTLHAWSGKQMTAVWVINGPNGIIAGLPAAGENPNCGKDASFILDAFAVATETGMTPRQLKDQRAELLAALKLVQYDIYRRYETEYAGRAYERCTSCDAILSEDQQHHTNCAWASIDAAIAKSESNL